VEKVHHLWTLDDHGRELRKDLERADKGIVIGGGLLGFDLIGSFNEVVDATYLVREDRWWHSVLTMEGAEIMHEAMREHGVDLHLEEEAGELSNSGEGKIRVVTNRDEYETGVMGIAVGHARNLELAEDAGLETGKGIICDEFLQGSGPDIYAAGDCAEYHDPVLEKRNLGGSWVTAQEQGEVAGKNMVGKEEALEFVDTYTVSHFGLNVASLGDPVETEGKEVVTAVDRDGQKYRKLVLDDGRIVGAAILGEMKWMHPLKQLIREKVDVSRNAGRLEEPGFDPGSLL
ncbi:MAG: FAD-dependent oxidoreductase, partial [Candidatus Nanohaloarchaea archaeon]